LLLAAPVAATPRESPWSASILGGPVFVQNPQYRPGVDDGEATAKLGLARRVTGAWDVGVEPGYTKFGRYFSGIAFDDGGIAESAGKVLDSFDLTLFARCHPNVLGIHPYVAAGAGAYAVHGFFPDVDPTRLTRQIKPGISIGAGLHGILRPALGLEIRWMTIYEGAGPSERPKKDVLNVLLSLTKE
jgi:hypothetical protein